MDLVKEYRLWGAFILSCFVVATYHIKLISNRYKTVAEIRNDHYTKLEVDKRLASIEYKHDSILEEIDSKLKSHVTVVELRNLEKFMDLRFTQHDKILNKMQEDLSFLSKAMNGLGPK